MTVILREYIPQTRDFKSKSGNMGGVVNDSESTTISITFPDGYLDDKDAYIVFGVADPETHEPYWYDFSTGAIEIPYEVTSKVEYNKLEYQLILIGKENLNYVEQSVPDVAMFARSIRDPQEITESVVPAAVELTALRQTLSELEARVTALEAQIGGGE